MLKMFTGMSLAVALMSIGFYARGAAQPTYHDDGSSQLMNVSTFNQLLSETAQHINLPPVRMVRK